MASPIARAGSSPHSCKRTRWKASHVEPYPISSANTVAPNQSISLFGVATSVTLSPSSLNFGNQKKGTVSDPQVVTLTNVGNKPVSIYSLGIIGQFPSVFLQTNNCGTTVAPGASCAINFQFAPQLTRGFIESLAVKDDGGGQMQTVQVTGTGT